MARPRTHRPASRRALAGPLLLLVLSMLFPTSAFAQGAGASRPEDDAFVQSLGRGPADVPPDRARLARLFSGVVVDLDGGAECLRSDVLEREARPPEPGGEQQRAREEFRAYEHNLNAFRRAVSELQNEPSSRLTFYRVFISGQRTCWNLDLHTQRLERRGLEPRSLAALWPSREACARFRTAVFHPRVEAILHDALVEQIYERHEMRELRKELGELEQLVEVLIQTDSD